MEKERLAKATVEERREVLVTKSNSNSDFLSSSFNSSFLLIIISGIQLWRQIRKARKHPNAEGDATPTLVRKGQKED